MKEINFLTLDSWIISDTHWEHKNIGRYCDRPEDHFELIRRNWMEMVAPDDVVFHLGDLCVFGNRKRHDQWLDGLPGDKHLLMGNHDDHPQEWYEERDFNVVGREPVLWQRPEMGGAIIFSHEPVYMNSMIMGLTNTVNIHGHVHNTTHRDPIDPKIFRNWRHLNACVEVTDYAPIRLWDLLFSNRVERLLS